MLIETFEMLRDTLRRVKAGARVLLDWLRRQAGFQVANRLTVNTADIPAQTGLNYPQVRRALARLHTLGLIVWHVGEGTNAGTELTAADCWGHLPAGRQRLLFGGETVLREGIDPASPPPGRQVESALALAPTPPPPKPAVPVVPEPLPEREPPRVDPPQPPAPETVATAAEEPSRACPRPRDITPERNTNTLPGADGEIPPGTGVPAGGMLAAFRRFVGLSRTGGANPAPSAPPPQAVPAIVSPPAPRPASPPARPPVVPAVLTDGTAAGRIAERAERWRAALRDPKTYPWVLRWLAFEADPSSAAGGLPPGKRITEADVERWLRVVDDLERRGKIEPGKSRGNVLAGCIRAHLKRLGRPWPEDLQKLMYACRRLAGFELFPEPLQRRTAKVPAR